MKILVEFNGRWGLGDKLLADPLYYHLKKLYGSGSVVHTSGDSGVSSRNPFVDGTKEDVNYDRVISIDCFDRMPIEEYQKLKAMPSLTAYMLSYAGIDQAAVENIRPNLYLTGDEKEAAFNKFLAKTIKNGDKSRLIAMCADYNDPRRHLEIKKWNRIARILNKKNYKIINLGLNQPLKYSDIDLVGATTFREAGAVISHCALFMGNNSALFHAAQAVGVASVCTFSLAEPRRFMHGTGRVYPVQSNIKCKNCMTRNMEKVTRTKRHCLRPWGITGKCMRMISVRMVMKKVDEALNDKENSARL